MELYHAMTCFIVYWQEFVRLNSSLPFVKVNSTPDWNLLLQMTSCALFCQNLLISVWVFSILILVNVSLSITDGTFLFCKALRRQSFLYSI